jgi:hypothetical protein
VVAVEEGDGAVAALHVGAGARVERPRPQALGVDRRPCDAVGVDAPQARVHERLGDDGGGGLLEPGRGEQRTDPRLERLGGDAPHIRRKRSIVSASASSGGTVHAPMQPAAAVTR